MDEFKDFAKEIRNRISNPFVFSFIASWLFTNWPITIAILFYDKIDLKNDGFQTLHDLIVHYSKDWWWFMVLYPMIIAGLYTAFFPMLRAEIKLHIAKITSKNESNILDKTNAGSMPLSKFIKLRNEHIATINQLKILTEQESGYLVINATLEKEKAGLLKEKLKIESDYSSSEYRLQMYKDLSFFGITNGKWEFIIETNNNKRFDLKLNFSEDIVRNIDNSNISYMIQDLVVNPFKNLIHFNLRPEDGQEPIGPVTLYGSDGHDYFSVRGTHADYKIFTMSKLP